MMNMVCTSHHSEDMGHYTALTQWLYLVYQTRVWIMHKGMTNISKDRFQHDTNCYFPNLEITAKTMGQRRKRLGFRTLLRPKQEVVAKEGTVVGTWADIMQPRQQHQNGRK